MNVITFNNKINIVKNMNNLIKSCFTDVTERGNLTFDIIDMKNATTIPDLKYFMDLLLPEEIPAFLYVLKSKNEIISDIITYFNNIDGKLYYCLHSKTKIEFEGKKYNQILRALFIITSKYIKLNDKSINYLGSQAINPIAYHIWTTKFNFKPVYEPEIMLTFATIKKLSGGLSEFTLALQSQSGDEIDIGRDEFITNLLNMGVNIDRNTVNIDKNLYFRTKAYVEPIQKNILTKTTQLKQFDDWNYYAKTDINTAINCIAPNNKCTFKQGILVLNEIFTKIKGTCVINNLEQLLNIQHINVRTSYIKKYKLKIV